MPVPLALNACGLPTPLLVTVIVALRVPAADGLNVTPTAQVAPALTVEQVLLATANSEGLLLATLETATGVPPILVMVTLVGELVAPSVWLPKLIDEVIDSWPGGTVAVPVPLTPTVSVPPVRLTVTFVLAAPATVGWKATLKLQLAPALTVTPLQVLAESGKCVASPLLAVTTKAAAVPAFEIVTVVVALVDPTVVDANATGDGAA